MPLPSRKKPNIRPGKPFDWREKASTARTGLSPVEKAVKKKAAAVGRATKISRAKLSEAGREFIRRVVDLNQTPNIALRQMGYADASVREVKKALLGDQALVKTALYGLQAHRISQIELQRKANLAINEVLSILADPGSEDYIARLKLKLEGAKTLFGSYAANTAMTNYERAVREDVAEVGVEAAAREYLRGLPGAPKAVEGR